MTTPRHHLDVIEVQEPCTESWEGMRGDGPARFCGLCRMNVYNLSAMTRDEAERVVQEREGRLCVRFYRRADGTVSTADCAPIRFAALRRTARRTMAGVAALLAGLLGLVASLGLLRLVGFDADDTPVVGEVKKVIEGLVEPEPIPLMGAVAIDPDFVPPEPIEVPSGHGDESHAPTGNP